MNVIQKNVFGNNNIYYIPPNFVRKLNDVTKKEIQKLLENLKINSATIRYENGGETQEFSKNIRKLLLELGLQQVNLQPVTQSEINRNQFTIEKHPSVENWAIIKIGPLI